MNLKDCMISIKKLNPAYRKMRMLRERCERMDGALGRMNDEIECLKKQIGRITPQASLNLVEVNIVPHCNLNCRLCSHFAPIAKAEYMAVESAERDFLRLAALSGGNIECIHIMGGEPLLHPQCGEFLKLARKHFPWSIIRLVTNGLLLPSRPESFWACLSDNWIDLSPTKYPVDVDWGFVADMCSEYHIPFGFFNDSGVRKTMTRFTLDRSGRQDPRESFRNCDCANNTVVMHEGRMYPCEIIPAVRHFNRRFNKALIVTGKDSIDMCEVRNMGEILSFLAKPVPFCRYCDVKNRVSGIAWERSDECLRPQIAEWADC